MHNSSTHSLEEIYFASRTALMEHMVAKAGLSAADAHDAFSGLGQYLQSYSGDLTLDAFIGWGTEILRPVIAFLAIRNDCRRSVLKAFGTVLSTAKDLGVGLWTTDELESDLWTWVLEHLRELQIPGRASLKTRVAAAARFSARAWKTSQLRHRDRFLDVRADVISHADGRQQTVLLPKDEDADDSRSY